ncbi:auxin-responsive protein SAUR15-like [Populus nigra]|uniref:auxin-responsive protein SAUR15-like n=1 Tax=Populus nigra TaxID=3691 RepID=UPI002B269650|nr:auxin-responsive protein SAUR15-like [Populus nigra]
MIKRIRGFRLGRKKLARFFKWIAQRRREPARLCSRDHPRRSCNSISKILDMARYFTRGAKTLCFPNSDPGYIKLGRAKPMEVPKGHLAVYVGESDGDTKRELVPVIFFNHPLFAELLQRTERVNGYNHSGGITIPCGYSEFEKVKTRIAAWENCHNSIWTKKHYKYW